MEDLVEQLLRHSRHIWRGCDVVARQRGGQATGFVGLDAALPEGGWPRDALLELVVSEWGVGELQLLLPAMRAASGRGEWLVWIAPPYVPYALALADSGIDLARLLLIRPGGEREVVWAMEQALRQPHCAMVLAWPGDLRPVMVRRLQLAAADGRSLGVLFRRRDWSGSAAALRLRLTPIEGGVQVHILKSRAACHRRKVDITLA